MGFAKDTFTAIETMIKRDALTDKELLDATSEDDDNELLALIDKELLDASKTQEATSEDDNYELLAIRISALKGIEIKEP